mgnify:CR=1 FL=1
MMNLQNFTSVQTFHTHTHNSLTHTTLSHTQVSHTQVSHTQLSHTQLSHTQLSLSHTQLSHIHTTLSHTTPSHTQFSHTHNSLTHTTLSHTQLSHTQLSHTTCALCGKCGTYGIGLALVGAWLSPLSPPLFVWQAWCLVASAFTLRGRRGTWRHRPALCVASVALMAMGWLWWFPFVAVDAAAIGVAGVAWWHRLSLWAAVVIVLHFVWQAWHFPFVAVDAAAVCVAGVALGDIDLHFVWQAWRLATFDPWQAWHLATLSCTAGVVLMGEGVRRCVWDDRRHLRTHTHAALSRITLSLTPLLHLSSIFHMQNIFYMQLSHALSHHLSSPLPFAFLPFPSRFHIFLAIIGRSWHVGLSGPLISGSLNYFRPPSWFVWLRDSSRFFSLKRQPWTKLVEFISGGFMGAPFNWTIRDKNPLIFQRQLLLVGENPGFTNFPCCFAILHELMGWQAFLSSVRMT